MVILFHLDLVREADRRVDDDLVIVLVGAVAAGGLGVPELDPGERLFLDGLLQVVRDAVFINVLIGLEAGRGRARLDLVLQDELEAVVDDGLTAQDVLEVLERDVDVREDLEVRFPGDARPGLPAGELFLLQFPGGFALLEFDVVTEAVLVDFRLHPFRGVLRGAETQTVQTERELVEAGARVVVIFAAGVHLAEQEFPVVFFFILVVVHRDAASEVLDLETLVEITGQDDVVAVPLARLVDRVREDLEDRMLTPFDPVRAEDDRGTQPDPVRTFQLLDGLIGIRGLFCHTSSKNTLADLPICAISQIRILSHILWFCQATEPHRWWSSVFFQDEIVR